MKHISAHTDTISAYAPAFANISEDDNGLMILTVRSQGAQNGSFIRMTKEELSALCKPCVIAEVVEEVQVKSKK